MCTCVVWQVVTARFAFLCVCVWVLWLVCFLEIRCAPDLITVEWDQSINTFLTFFHQVWLLNFLQASSERDFMSTEITVCHRSPYVSKRLWDCLDHYILFWSWPIFQYSCVSAWNRCIRTFIILLVCIQVCKNVRKQYANTDKRSPVTQAPYIIKHHTSTTAPSVE